MQTTTALQSPVHESAMQYQLNTLLFMNALDGISEKQAKERISDHNNPVVWLAAHTVWARFNACFMLGKQVANPYQGLFEKFKSFDSALDYGTLSKAKEEWRNATECLNDALATLSNEHLAAESPLKSPMGDNSFAGAVNFLAHHETYQIGQIAFLKKYLTGEPMKYQ